MDRAKPEQKIAIEAESGILLSAGAGSGKTFVIVQHLLFLLDKKMKLISSMNFQTDEEREKKLAREISEIVIMTFTKKAAGELKGRVKKEIERKIEKEGEGQGIGWGKIKKYLDRVTIGTIDSFCSKVLRSNLIPGIENNFEIVDNAKRSLQLSERIQFHLNKIFNESEQYRDMVGIFYEDLLNVFLSIFLDPQIRLIWDKGIDLELEQVIGKEAWLEFFETEDFDQGFWEKRLPDGFMPESEGRAWHNYFSAIEKAKKDHPVFWEPATFRSLREDVFSLGKYYPRGAKIEPRVMKYAKELRKFQDIILNHVENIEVSLGVLHTETSDVHTFWSFLQSFYHQVQKEYEELEGMTFSDLSINLLKGLENPMIQQRVSQRYKYFIVDEFQDTSPIQFEIIMKIIGGDCRKLFAVGDKKQAIYGFRGGELHVFNSLENKTNFNHSLLNNFRSCLKITKFNNIFFEKVLNLGEKFQGIDRHCIDFEAQKTPDEIKGEGRLIGLQLENLSDWIGEGRDKWTSIKEQMSYIESELLLRKVLDHDPSKSLAILYSKIKLSYELVEKLLKKGVGFTAQMNLEISEEPVLELLRAFLLRKISEKKNNVESYFFIIYHSILNYLGLKVIISPDQAYEFFIREKEFWGMKISFYKLLLKMGISISQLDCNLKIMNMILDESGESEGKFLHLMGQRKKRSYKMNLVVGENPERVQIMTVHASKGLEFHRVMLGGIYKNGGSYFEKKSIGQSRGAFSWFLRDNDKKKWDSPIFLQEEKIKKEKDFSEKKRLLYVACTRAEEELIWCDFPGYTDGKQASAWFRAFEVMRKDISDLVNVEKFKIPLRKYSGRAVYRKIDLPLYQRDNLGICSRVGDMNLSFTLLPEVSVTKISEIALCPRYFYFKEILKLSFEDIESLTGLPPEGDRKIISSLKRGTVIHREIESFLKGEAEKTDLTNWLGKELEKYPRKEWKYIVEKLHKFEIFNYMVTGIPDLLLKGRDTIRVVDFKTGLREPIKEKAYWFQLMLYAWPYRDRFFNIELSIIYLDERKILSRKIDRLKLLENIEKNLSRADDFFEKDESYCQECIYQNLCK